MQHDPESIRHAVLRQWDLIAEAIPGIDLGRRSRISDWTNREVVAHLTRQPALLRKFLETSSAEEPRISLAANLRGTRSLAEMIDVAAREGASNGKIDFARALDRATEPLIAADLTATVTTVQGPIKLTDYLITRCIEGVVHGRDLVEPVEPDPLAEAITADALLALLAQSAAKLLDDARSLPVESWIDIATGREEAQDQLAAVCPLMS